MNSSEAQQAEKRSERNKLVSKAAATLNALAKFQDNREWQR
jgi:hypothetical protein